MKSSVSSAASRRAELGVLTTGLPASVNSARICPSPGVSISSASAAAGSSPKTSRQAAHAAAPAPELRRRGRGRARRACSTRRRRGREHRAAGPVEVAGQHVAARRRASWPACRTPACACRCARTPRPSARRRARARGGGSSSASMPHAGATASGVKSALQRAHLRRCPSTCAAIGPARRGPRRTARATIANSSSASVPGRMKWCSSASSAVSVRRGSIDDDAPAALADAAQPPAHVGRGHQAAVGRERVGAEHEQVVGAVDVGHGNAERRRRT